MSDVAELVLSLADELTALEAADVDRSIERALRRVSELAAADRGYVFVVSEDGQTVSNTHEWCAPGVAPARDALQELPRSTFPWAFSMLEGLAELRVPRVTDAPPSPERDEWVRESIQSLYCTPLHVHGRPIGFLGCDWVRQEDPLAAATTRMLRVAGVLVASALERHRVHRLLEQRRAAEELLQGISSRFVHVGPQDADQGLYDALARLGTHLRADAACLVRLDRTEPPRCTHAWRSGALSGVPDLALVRPAMLDPATWSNRPAPAEPDGCPDAAAAGAAPEVGAALDVPLWSGDQLMGVLGFATGRRGRGWTAEELRLARRGAEILASALSRLAADEKEHRLRAQLRQTQKLEILGQLAGGIAHDFNNMLMSITVGVDNALRVAPTASPVLREALGDIHDAAERAAALTRQLLTFSRRRVVQTRRVALNDIVEEMLRMVRRVVRESIRIDVRLDPALPAVDEDPSHLEQVLLNLCLNASDAMPRGGRLTLTTATAVEDGATRVLLSVRDTGVGMPPEVRERVFEPFFTTKPPGMGSGLGLSTVYGIVKSSGGSIRVESTPGQGTLFEILFPAAGRLPETAPARTAASAPPAGRERILLAEDDPAVRRLVSGVLRQAGYSVLTAPDGEEALALFQAHADIHAVILDAVMPGRGGLEAFLGMEQTRPGVRALFSSGYAAQDFPEGFFAEGRRAFIEKPYDGPTLLRRLRELLDRA